MASKNNQLHNNEPRNLGYSERFEPYYSSKREEPLSYIRGDSSTIFAGATQANLFLLCVALAKYENKTPLPLKKKVPNILTNAMEEKGKWLILGLGLSEKKDLICLKDEAPLYQTAEMYAEAGFEILQSLMQHHGSAFGDYLENRLKEIVVSGQSSKSKDDEL